MEQFSLQEYLKNPSRRVVTGDGRKVKILCTNRKSLYPIVALVENHDSDNESVCSYREDGLYSMFSQSEENNLFFAPEKHVGWINIFFAPEKHTGWINIFHSKDASVGTGIFNSKEEAEKIGKFSTNYVTTIKIEWEE